jgi:regulator of replication initiation timing
MANQEQQPQLDDAELDVLRQQVRALLARHREQNTMVRLFDVIQDLQPIPQLLDELATLRAENKTLRARLGEA